MKIKTSITNMLLGTISSLIAVFVIVAVAVPGIVSAQGVAVSGSFYRQYFKLIPGESVSTPDIYIIVFNREAFPVQVHITDSAPENVDILLSEQSFELDSGAQKKVTVGVVVGKDAVPGDYTLTVTAEIESDQPGIALKGASQQQAKLTVFGEAGTAQISTLDCLGNPYPAELHVCRLEDNIGIACGYSSDGTYDSRLVPGEYIVEAFYQDNVVAKQTFTVESNTTTNVEVHALTALVSSFAVSPNYYSGTGAIAFADVYYSINNLLVNLNNAKINLAVFLDGQVIDTDTMLSSSVLNTGVMDGNYKYVPSDGWKEGQYTFNVSIESDSNVCSDSPTQTLDVTADKLNRGNGNSAGNGTSPWVWAGIGAGTIIIAGAIYFLVFRRKAIM